MVWLTFKSDIGKGVRSSRLAMGRDQGNWVWVWTPFGLDSNLSVR